MTIKRVFRCNTQLEGYPKFRFTQFKIFPHKTASISCTQIAKMYFDDYMYINLYVVSPIVKFSSVISGEVGLFGDMGGG